MRIHFALRALLLLLSACAPEARSATAPAELSAEKNAERRVDLVESAPLETNLDHPDIPDAYQVWPEMIASAQHTLDVAQFYISNKPESRLEPTLQAIEAAADRGVRVRVLADASFAKRYPESLDRLARRSRISVRRFEVGKVMGGVLHAKYFVVDGREAFVGSQNFDWRSLTHIQEMGVRIRDPEASAYYERVFALDWQLAAGESAQPAGEPQVQPQPQPKALQLAVIAEGGRALVSPVASPKGFLPEPSTWELPRMVELIDGAQKSVHVQVLTMKTTSRDGSPFPDLDEALRRAAGRGVEVEILVSDWSKRRGSVETIQSLARVKGVAARFLTIPPWSGGFVPFARVAHAKYLVVDGQRAWVGTSNWEGDYFTRTRNVGIIVHGDAFAQRLDRVFHDGFAGPYAEPVDPDRVYTPPRLEEPRLDEPAHARAMGGEP